MSRSQLPGLAYSRAPSSAILKNGERVLIREARKAADGLVLLALQRQVDGGQEDQVFAVHREPGGPVGNGNESAARADRSLVRPAGAAPPPSSAAIRLRNCAAMSFRGKSTARFCPSRFPLAYPACGRRLIALADGAVALDQQDGGIDGVEKFPVTAGRPRRGDFFCGLRRGAHVGFKGPCRTRLVRSGLPGRGFAPGSPAPPAGQAPRTRARSP